jgi:hypothetical protein
LPFITLAYWNLAKSPVALSLPVSFSFGSFAIASLATGSFASTFLSSFLSSFFSSAGLAPVTGLAPTVGFTTAVLGLCPVPFVSSFFFSTTYVTPPAFSLSLRDLAMGSSSSPLSSALPGLADPYPTFAPVVGFIPGAGLAPPGAAVYGLLVGSSKAFSLSFLSPGLVVGLAPVGLGTGATTSGILMPCFLASAALRTYVTPPNFSLIFND